MLLTFGVYVLLQPRAHLPQHSYRSAQAIIIVLFSPNPPGIGHVL